MNFDFSDEQVQLQDAVRRWVDKSYTFEHYRATVQAGGFERANYAQLAELGLCGLLVAEEHGGLAMGPVEAMLVMQELGAGLVLEPLTQTLIVSSVLARFAPPELQQQWLPGLASGQTLAALAWVERGARYRHTVCQATATATATGHAMTATKSVVAAGDQADAFVVSALLEGALALFWVPRSAAGVQTRGHGLQDGSRGAELTLTDAPATLITRDGVAALELALDVGIAAACAQGVGVMDKALALTAGYLNTRKQFGVAIGTFQALRHRVADMKMQLELARSMSYYASLKLSAPAPERRAALARAKVQLGQSMRYVGQQSVQLHGGIGVTDEYIGSHYFKKLTQLELSFGDTLHHLGEVASRMTDTAGVFA
ncbi:MAG: acyl-CoA dehydrogenase [Comamonadaceae bacterium CG1_02_60_18]|nr:MAG: acyl-CoA dehydrogenase [Comamonadaceae bacterium CG1_02_60_18]PIQ52538.1 MAG: acyl-CoA dehydrogenase [Comamonadaceae bacterium CG12_big_fil_rev_8_21_14_0_65_59_15]